MNKTNPYEWIKGKISEISAPLSSSRVELLGNFAATVHGCKKIVQYSPEKIKLAMKKKGSAVTLEGSGLVCTSFFVGAVVVEGKIERVELSESVGEGGK